MKTQITTRFPQPADEKRYSITLGEQDYRLLGVLVAMRQKDCRKTTSDMPGYETMSAIDMKLERFWRRITEQIGN